jgi:hypothetical protein
MRPFLLTALVLLFPWSAVAADDAPTENRKQPPRHTELSPQEIAQGWILLFDGETPFGWRGAEKWTIFDGLLSPQSANTKPLVTTTAFGDCELKIEYRLQEGTGKAEIIFGSGPDGQATSSSHKLPLQQPPFRQSSFWELDATVTGRQVQTSVSSGLVRLASASATPVTSGGPIPPPIRGHIALSGNGVVFRSIKLKPTMLTHLFNGKDLTGWKEIHTNQTKSKFTVTKEGWLNIKNGRGDLQTEREWADFILQLDCISNGDHLNSGVFFRCIPGQFWSGYEAQIRNQWKDGDRTKPVDYGTGAIYNRQPARKVVSSDREWFTMTVAAQGKHLAVWVNGYQTADFTDERPPSDNARKGCKTGKGPISLQGHDATTDLSFRNLRIADLDAPTPTSGKK